MRKTEEGSTVAAERALRLLRLLAGNGEIRLTELSRELGLPHSTTHRLLATLRREGFALQDAASRRYVAGPGMWELGWLLDPHGLRLAARPHLRALAEEFGEATQLVVLQGRYVEFLDGVESERQVRHGTRLGRPLPSHLISGGKAMLARLPRAILDRLYPDEELLTMTPASVRTKSRLLEQLALARERGYATNVGETEAGVCAVGAAVVDRYGRARCGLVVAGPDTRLLPEDLPVVGDRVAEAARLMAEELRFDDVSDRLR
ncbi:IclR family transcriptional regulator [Allokutzneria albata]|uniref:Glycerol operon regulatory protein n=1 Tax=Allokutzneria albata TaxID=211114 RepID=A0A1G9TRH7_ALLAB|nr:IclR family transcriptional regulator [Allokutzneria albata]SDM50376.1 DNA-binding transcriptional regulator, IclR family [Allokutzneria albata]